MSLRTACTCEGCGVSFDFDAAAVRRGRGRFCNRACALRVGRIVRWERDKRDVSARFDAHVVRRGSDDCWSWSGFKHKGYGRLRSGSRAVGAHRISWELANGPIPGGLTVLHRCDNPECTNPGHLFLGTNADNNLDRDTKGRAARGERIATARVSEDQVREIRASGKPASEIAAAFGIGKRTANAILSGETWKHVQ